MAKTRRVKRMQEDNLAKAKLKEAAKRDLAKIPEREIKAMAETKTIIDNVFARLSTIEKRE